MNHLRLLLRRLRALFYEKQTCGRRCECGVASSVFPGPDRWEKNRWGWKWPRRLVHLIHNGWPYRQASKIREWGWSHQHGTFAHWLGEKFNWYGGGTNWEWPWQPRTCSFCGGVHPEDAIRLVKEGWLASGTDKGYKWYLEPPIVGERRVEWSDRPYPVRAFSAVPPVKLYVQHFTQEQIDRFNAAVETERKVRKFFGEETCSTSKS